MWQQKQNNFTRLDELSGLPGEMPMDKNAAWQKLEHQLHRKPRSIKTVWYWAAACTLFLIFSLAINFAEHHTPGIARQLPVPASLAGPGLPEKKNKFVAAVPAKKIENKMASFSVKAPRLNPVAKIHAPNPGITIVLPAFEKLTIVDPPVSIDSSSLVSALPAKKKLKVVNTNELDDADRFASKSLPKTGADYTDSKKAAKKEYAGMLNFRIYLKN